ncbi:MAG TPA: UBA domain-containing protein [Amaricoccus sp.]|nr:UBA domain-containing protein [Amaricoccus sp.]
MTTNFTNTAEISTGRTLPVRAITAIATALVRARARHAYRQMLERENHILADMGVSRRDVRQALHDCGGNPEARPAIREDRS